MVARSCAIIFIEFLQKVRIANLGPVISAITESQTESRNQTSKKEFSFCQNYCNLALLNRNLQVNKLISTLWLANCHFYASPRCLHVKGSRRSTLDACHVVYMWKEAGDLPWMLATLFTCERKQEIYPGCLPRCLHVKGSRRSTLDACHVVYMWKEAGDLPWMLATLFTCERKQEIYPGCLPRCLHVKGSRRSTLDACFWMCTAQPIIKITVTKIVRMPFFHWIMIIWCFHEWNSVLIIDMFLFSNFLFCWYDFSR